LAWLQAFQVDESAHATQHATHATMPCQVPSCTQIPYLWAALKVKLHPMLKAILPSYHACCSQFTWAAHTQFGHVLFVLLACRFVHHLFARASSWSVRPMGWRCRKASPHGWAVVASKGAQCTAAELTVYHWSCKDACTDQWLQPSGRGFGVSIDKCWGL